MKRNWINFFILILSPVFMTGCRVVLEAQVVNGTGSTGASSSSQDGRGLSTSRLDHTFHLLHNGIVRRYNVHLPRGYWASRQDRAVIISMHGGGGNAEGQAQTDGLDAKADREGFISVHPQGYSPLPIIGKAATWNAGTCCGPAVEKNVDDVGFINRVIDDLIRRFRVDQKRIYATGLSNGGMMAIRLACELSDRIAAIAPVGAVNTTQYCEPKRGVSMIHFHGMQDRCVPFNGGQGADCLGELVGVPINAHVYDSVPNLYKLWKEENALSDVPSVTTVRNSSTCRQFGGSEGVDLESCLLGNGGHTWPAGQYGNLCAESGPINKVLCQKFKTISGPISYDFDATDRMWRFFQAHPQR